MAGPLLLVHDDPQAIAAIQRVLARQSHPVVVATTVRAARSALKSAAPGLLLLAPRVDGARGQEVLDALGPLEAPVLFLGDGLPGSSHPIAPLPPAPDFLGVVLGLVQSAEDAAAREVLATASRALGRARAAAAAARDELQREVEQLREQTRRDEAALADEREARTKLAAEHQALRATLAASQASNEELGEKLGRLTEEHRAVTATRDALDVSLREELERSRERAEVAAALETRRKERQEAERQSLQQAQSAGERTHHALEEVRAERTQLSARLAELQAQLADARQALEASRSDRAAEQEHTRSELARGRQAVEAAQLGRAAEEQRAQEELAGVTRALEASQRDRAIEERQSRVERSDLEARLARVQQALQTSQQEHAAEREAQLALSRAERAELLAQAATLQAELARVRHQSAEDGAAAAGALAAAKSQIGNLEQLLATARESSDTQRARAELAEAQALAALQRAHELENRAALELTVEEAPVAIPRAGTLGLGTLARLALQLTRGEASVRLELTAPRGVRRLWLEQGALVAAESTLRSETLSDRARRDGLIDAQQDAQLRALGDVSPTDLLEELRLRGLVRRAEVPGLLRRSAEEIALEALSEHECSYRLVPELPVPALRIDGSSRPMTLLLALALRRAFPWESHLELLGGTQAVPRRLGPVEAQAFGFSDTERRMLEAIDGHASVAQLVVSSHLQPEGGYRVLSAAKLLGLIELSEARAARPPPVPVIALLQAKYEQVQQADYFEILDLPRTADAAQVQRARELLSNQLEPLRYADDADASTQHRARVVLAVIDEAARTLGDDRLRVAYARHLRE